MIIAGIVLYNPDISRLKENIDSIYPQVDKLVFIENGSSNIDYLQLLNQGEVIVNDGNMGIAYALNQIMQFASDHNSEWVLTLDQDSVVPSNLMETYSKLTSLDKVGIISCKIVDRNFGETSKEKKKDSGYEEVPMCITSASLLRVKAWKEAGGFANDFFIDAVDFDMCLLLREHGYKIIRTYDTALLHEVGHSRKVYLLGKEELVFNHNPLRCYYMIRNSILLGKRHHQLFRQIGLAVKRFLLINLFETNKFQKNKMMLTGIYHAIIGKYGKYCG